MTRVKAPRQARGQAIPMVDLRAQHALLEKEILDGVAAVMKTGRFILGEPGEVFERQLAAICKSRFAIGCNSGTDALWLALRALGIGPGDAVLCPAYSFFASASTIARLGARPVFCDVDPETFNLDPDDAIRRAESDPDVRAVLSVDLFGRICELGPLESYARERGWPIVEDAAQALGSVDLAGAPPGGQALIACLSFYPTKNLGALGDAGGLLTSDAGLAARIQSLRSHGESAPGEYGEIGINSRLDAIQAVALSIKLPHLESWTRARQELAALYDALFADRGAAPARHGLYASDLRLATPSDPTPVGEPNRHSYHRYVIRVPAEERERIIAALHEQGIASEIYYRRGLHQQPALARYVPKDASFPETERAAREALALPLYPELAPAAIERIVDCVSRTLRS